mmetsp:Transcript_24182/g.37290  ORF Transcript_24182/g.37290 Transcript_24182/m.37290 type:complete len:88 (-) Transcript_24182:101-364(-)
MTALAGHARVPIFASGSHAQYIKICAYDGDALQVVRTHDQETKAGKIGQRIGPVSCLEFHPHRLLLAAGATDEFTSIFRAEYSTSRN